MKVWITVGVAVCWIAVFSVWVVSQDTQSGGSDPAVQNATAGQASPNEPTPPPQNRANWQPRPRGFQSHSEQPHRSWRHGGPGRIHREAYGFGLVLLATLDKNKDAVLSETEIARMKEALLTLDENTDGEVSREELSAAMPAAMAALYGEREDQPQWNGFRDRWRRWHRPDSGDRPAPDETGADRREAPGDQEGRPARPWWRGDFHPGRETWENEAATDTESTERRGRNESDASASGQENDGEEAGDV